LRGNVLAEAQTGVGRLEARDGRRWVPRSTVRALDAVAAAEKLLRERGEADAAVRAAAATANNEVQHALFLLERVRGACEGNDPARLESAVLDWEAALQRTLERSNTSADFSAGMSAGLESLEVRVTRLVRERDAERAWSRYRGSASDSLRLAVTALAESLRARDIAIASLQQLRRRQLRIEGLQHDFARSEGRILQDGPDVVLRLPGVTFVAGQAALTPESTPVLEKVAAALAQFPGARFVVEGHSDAQGRPETNLQLSQQRADAVRADLIARARLEPSRITAVGRGSARPIAAETDAAGREANRRIEIVIAPVD
jgi:outer membrane protein OmpA-like peptidoglycan-associated protein